MTQNQDKLIKILSEIFQLDQSDLDFGIYRIMNSKSEEIRNFLENDLLAKVKEAFSSNSNNSTQIELDKLIQTISLMLE
jgi:adenine-specific DNA-methyltransferase